MPPKSSTSATTPVPRSSPARSATPYFFGTAWQNDAYHEAAGKFATERGFKKVAVLAPNYPAGKDALTGFKRASSSRSASETYTKLGQLDYAAELAEIRARSPDAVYIFLPGGMGINFIKQFVGAGLSKNTQIVGPGFSADEDVINAVGEPMLGMFNTAHWSHDFHNPANQNFVRPIQKEYGRLPSIYAAQAYDAALLIDAAVRDVKGELDDKAALRKALKAANFKSVRGDFKFNTNQFPIQNYYLRTVVKDAAGAHDEPDAEQGLHERTRTRTPRSARCRRRSATHRARAACDRLCVDRKESSVRRRASARAGHA